MDFEEWEIDDDLWHTNAEAGETPPWDPPVEDAFHDALESAQDPEDPFHLALADADNGFNNLSRLNMLWDVRHRWARGSRFTFNMYRHDSRLLVCSPAGLEPEIISSKEDRKSVV